MRTQANQGGPVLLRDVLTDRATRDPERLAFAEGERRLTFGGLAERASACAAALQRKGVTPEDRVALAMSAGLDFVVVFWALQLIGAAPCAFNPRVPAQTLRRRLELVRPALVITDELAHELLRAGGTRADTQLGPDGLAFLQPTSGTSGTPRASMILQRNVMSYLSLNRTEGFLNQDDVLVCWAPPWHDLGLVRFVIGSVYGGVSCHLVEPAARTIPDWFQTIARVRGTYTAAPDFAFRLATRMVDPSRLDLSSLRFMKSGGEPVRSSTMQLFERHFGLPGTAVPGYGLGEVTLGVSEHLPGEEIPVDERGTVSCGFVNPGLELRAGNSIDHPDEILVRGDTVFAGYFDAPEETRRALRDGWLHTGDSGYQDAEGRLFVLGRRAGMIKRAGAVVAPRELEEAAQRAGGVRVAAAVSLPGALGVDDTIVVAVEADLPPAEIEAAVSREVVAALGFAPGRIRVLPRRSIPRTENGKIRHSALQALLTDPHEA